MKSLLFLVLGFHALVRAAPLPPRPAGAVEGSAFAARIAGMTLAEREAAVREQFMAGNVPGSWRQFTEVKISRVIGGREHTAILSVAPDYLAIGSDADALLMPLTPGTARELAAHIECTLPTRRMVDEIHRAAPVKLTPAPLPPGAEMTSVGTFARHCELVRKQQTAHPAGQLTAGHKKDLVLTARLATAPGKVAIYGWHRPDGTPIQPLYTGHASTWVDYSHGVRLVASALTVDGAPSTVAAVLGNPALAELLSDEGAFQAGAAAAPAWPEEKIITLHPADSVRAVINAPARRNAARPLRLVIYAAPAGNTIEQTFGRRTAPGEDWHFEIQHLTAQTRWLRMHDDAADLAVAVLQCDEQSWPAWRRTKDPDNRRIPGIITAVRNGLGAPDAEVILSGHSAGGSFVFGYIDAVTAIPGDITRVCFLDSNYAYSAEKRHHEKLAAWLRGGDRRHLCVVAYHDSAALLNGKPFVSEAGGTWGRSHAMLRDLAFDFSASKAGTLQRHAALGGRVQFLLMENPEQKVLHTRLVEWNGFIHSLLTGSEKESQGYAFPGPAVYQSCIPPGE